MPSRLVPTLMLIGLLAGAMAQAADPAPKPAPKKGNVLTLGSGKPGGKLLTRDQLRQCLAQQKDLKEQDTAAAAKQAALNAKKADINRLGAELQQQAADLETERATVDATKAEAVDAFNAKLAQREERVREHGVLVDGYNAQLAPLNAQIQALTATRQTWLAECGDRSYDELDYFAIQRGK